MHGKTDTHKGTRMDKDRQTDTKLRTETHTNTHRYRHTETHTETDTHRRIEPNTHTQRQKQTHTQYTHTDRWNPVEDKHTPQPLNPRLNTDACQRAKPMSDATTSMLRSVEGGVHNSIVWESIERSLQHGCGDC